MPVGKISIRGNVIWGTVRRRNIRSGNCLFGELSASGIVRLGNCPSGNYHLLWNGLPQSLKQSESILELKRKLEELGNVNCFCILCR